MDYLHWNPVKHGYVREVKDWPYSSFHRYVARGRALRWLAMIIVMWFSRWREFRADSGGAKLAGRDKMIRALERLGASVQQDPMPEQLQAFGIAGKPSGLARLFMSHPPLEERIAALRALYT